MSHAGPPSHSSDSEDSAPELLTLSSTKKESRLQAEAINAFEAAQKAKQKRENRARDVSLKEAKARAREKKAQVGAQNKQSKEQKRGKEKADIDEAGMIAASAKHRMDRAMREAAEEESPSLESGSQGNDQEEWAGVTMSVADTENESVDGTNLESSNHLPEHLFAAAAAGQQSFSKRKVATATGKPVKRKRKKAKAKDRVVGSRMLLTSHTPQGDTLMASLTLPPPRVNKFLKRTLQLRKSTNSSSIKEGGMHDPKKIRKGAPQKWERRPVNLGVLRSATGPALRFVRE